MSGTSLILRFLAEPIVLLLIIGVGIFLAYERSDVSGGGGGDARIHIDVTRINASIAEWEELFPEKFFPRFATRSGFG